MITKNKITKTSPKSKKIVTEDITFKDQKFEQIGITLKNKINKIFGKSIAIRALDSGSDNSTEIELVNLTTPHYDVERFGISFVASPRHADIITITGAVTQNMAIAVKKPMMQPRPLNLLSPSVM